MCVMGTLIACSYARERGVEVRADDGPPMAAVRDLGPSHQYAHTSLVQASLVRTYDVAALSANRLAICTGE